MTDLLSTNHYSYAFSEDSIEIRLLPIRISVLSLIFSSLLIALLLVFSVICFIYGGLFYAITFLFAGIVFGALLVAPLINQKKRAPVFRFILNNDGVTHIDTDASYFIPWSEVKQFGFVDKITSLGRHKRIQEKCLYFSSEEHDEELLKKKFRKMDFVSKRHYSTKEMILFRSGEKNIPDRIYTRLDEFIKEHCGEAKELNLPFSWL